MNKKILTLALMGILTLGVVGTALVDSSEEKVEKEQKISESINQGDNVLVLEYDKEKYKLVKMVDQHTNDEAFLLVDKALIPNNIYADFVHIKSKSMQVAADYLCKIINMHSKATKSKSDLDIDSIKVSYPSPEDNSTQQMYFIDDKQGGCYRLMINDKKKKVIKSIKLLPEKGNENLMKDIKQN
ncbi:hypothetical protein IZY60_15210 [Lutibacter sp. B2]|nr:hypothetical protein [Lutibacter sp. B2]